ncbi:NitT/TauT family transport system ATP-binding protein [Bradyrhizobium macuxiense]|uniref:NitT/TauT family transport system ATP-binding protein n=1 Tax=Bradyrhizobium macuxiense TaxID=1755647 RepID=A0A560L087_9BRAD|nr:ABC transporter ATP-binding protein [Bradyrhizobium macuxiense]TWB87804.1 NitT/TauT family transport system ATP-binding protein [Bradyrhizobium macuxiense]
MAELTIMRKSAQAPSGEPEAAILQAKDVTCSYTSRDGSSVTAIQRASFDIRQGEFVSILGPSGCGKSTLLMIMAGLLKASGGSVSFKGGEIVGPPEDFGFVFQDPVLLPWRTVQKNVELPGELRGMSGPELSRRAVAMLELVKLAGFSAKYPHELSGGMRQRVAIARALVMNPSLLLMDEPFGALDAMTRDKLNLDLQRIGIETGATIMFVTHSIPEAVFLSDRVLVMSSRPSTVSAVVSIEIPRPRPIEMMNTDAFGSYVSELRRRLDGGHNE